MGTDENWYRQLAALVLMSASRTAVEFITNPDARADTTGQLKGALSEIDYESLAQTVTQTIEGLADTSKDRLSGTIDVLRDKGVGVVGDAKNRAKKQAGQGQGKSGGMPIRFILGLLIGALIAYFVLDEQRRDDLLDRLTGASGPIQQNYSNGASDVTASVPTDPEITTPQV